MRLADLMAEQLRLPRGPLAPLAAHSLNQRNADLIRQSIDALEVGPRDHVIDVGFGGGLSLRLLLRAARQGRVFGVDPSPAMVRRAGRALAHEVTAGRLVVRTGTANAIPFGEEQFHRLLTCQTVYFWSDVPAGLAELYRVLAPGGRCVVAMMPRPLQEQFGFAERGYNLLSHRELGRWLAGSGFEVVARWSPAVGSGRWVVVGRKP